MPGYSKETARLWMAMDIGPLWIGRDEDDPLSPQSIAKDSTAKEITEAPKLAAEQNSAHSDDFKPASPLNKTPPHEHSVLTSPESHKPKTFELKPIRRSFAEPGIVEVDSELLTRAQNADWKTLQTLVSQCTACKALSQSRLSTVFGTAKDCQDGDCRGSSRA